MCNLATILEVFLPALNHTMPHEELRCLISVHLEALLDRHTVLLAQFREQTTSPEGMVGEIFCSLCCRSDVSMQVTFNPVDMSLCVCHFLLV